jgi:xanthine/uracil permease
MVCRANPISAPAAAASATAAAAHSATAALEAASAAGGAVLLRALVAGLAALVLAVERVDRFAPAPVAAGETVVHLGLAAIACRKL